MTFSLWPSSMPVTRFCSDSLSITRILSTMEAGRLLSAIDWSSKKKVRPPTVMRLTSSPLTLTLPSSPMSIPGIRTSRSLSMAFAPTWKEEALYSMVSFLMMMGLPTSVMVAARMNSSSICSLTVPTSTRHFSKRISFTQGR